MLTHIPHVLDEKKLMRISELLATARFVDGRLSAGPSAERVKNNEEVATDDARIKELNDIVMGSLLQNPAYEYAALPHRVAVPYYVRYAAGMHYGDHIDDPVMGVGNRYRSDIAITVFLNDPQAYDGGELVIHTSFGEKTVKHSAGDAVLYPASNRHKVTEVTRGERLVAVTWVQSLVRDPNKRELLYELYQAREKLRTTMPDAEETKQVENAYVNLVRMWSEL